VNASQRKRSVEPQYKMTSDQFLYDMAYRLHAVDTLRLAMRYTEKWADDPPPRLEIHVDGKLQIEGNLYAFTNPATEAGLIHCRALLEFLGLTVKAGHIGNIDKKKRRSSDIGIEDFPHLSMVNPDDALGRYPGSKEEAEKALLAVFQITNKGIGHFTAEIRGDPENNRLIEIASRYVPALVITYLYVPLGLPIPDYRLSHRLRDVT
jgi:hypothetical protein